KRVHLKLPEELFCDGIVAALGIPLASIVAPAEMNGEDHTRALGALQTGIVGSNGFVKRLVGVSSNLIFDVAAPLWIDVVAVARRVDLDVMHSFIHERLNLCFNNGHDVPEESRVARINLVADTLLVVDRRKLIGGWQGNLYV